jgi:hypothetical protein
MHRMLSRRSLLAGGLSALALARVRPAQATLVRAVTLTELVSQSRHAVVATPGEASSRWETIGGRERIVTYTQVRVEYPLDGTAPASSELVVRTLGGRVGDIGQIVAGEALLRRRGTAALFLEPIASDVFVVTAMSQGHYPILADIKGARRLHAPSLTLRQMTSDAAVVRLDGRTVAEVEGLVYQEVARGAR